MPEKRIIEAIRDIADFPRKGIVFKDITPILMDSQLCNDIVESFAQSFSSRNIDLIAGIESRGFLFGMLLAQRLNVPFVPLRKAGKLPGKTIKCKYELEYGSAEIEIQEDAISKGQSVLIHDDLLATGGTAVAAAQLVQMCKANICGFAFLVELEFLPGRENLKKYSDTVVSLVKY